MESIIDAVNELLLQHTQLCGIIYKLRESSILMNQNQLLTN